MGMTTVHLDGLPTPQRYWAVVTVALGVVMAVMDSAIARIKTFLATRQ